MKNDFTGSKLLKGAAILGIAAFISKILGSLFKIPFQNIAGNGALGIYNIVYPFYILILFLSTAGIPIAVSKFVSEYSTKGDYYNARQVLKISIVLMTFTGLFFFSILFFAADLIAAWTADTSTKLSIQSVSFALLIVPIMAVLRGYFQGFQDMAPTGVSQVVEQIFRVTFMLIITYWFVQQGLSDAWTSAGATFGAVAGAVGGLLVMLYYWYKHQRQIAVVKRENAVPAAKLTKQIILFSLPICLGYIVVPMFNIVDSFTIVRFLQWAGNDVETARNLFGIYGYGLPLVQLMATFASSLSVALVPSIAEANTRGEQRVISARTNLAMRLTLLLGLPASVGLAVLSTPIVITLYKNDLGTSTMAILAFTTIFSTLNIVSTGILQGVGAVTIPARNLIIAAVVKVILNILLVPIWEINGAAVASVLSFALATVLNLTAITKHTGVSFSFIKFSYKPILATLIMGIAIFVVMEGLYIALNGLNLQARLLNTIVTTFTIFAGVIVYSLAIFKTGAVTRGDLNAVPRLSGRLIPLLGKLKLLPKEKAVNTLE